MAAVYLKCEINLDDEYPAAGFGYDGIPVGEYAPPIGANYIRSSVSNSLAAEQPFGQLELTSGDFSGGYVYGGVSMANASRPGVGGIGYGVYEFSIGRFVRFYIPSGLTGPVSVFAKMEGDSEIGIEFVVGGGAGYVEATGAGSERILFVNVVANTNSDVITTTVHVVSSGGGGSTEPPEFWTGFIGAREII